MAEVNRGTVTESAQSLISQVSKRQNLDRLDLRCDHSCSGRALKGKSSYHKGYLCRQLDSPGGKHERISSNDACSPGRRSEQRSGDLRSGNFYHYSFDHCSRRAYVWSDMRHSQRWMGRSYHNDHSGKLPIQTFIIPRPSLTLLSAHERGGFRLSNTPHQIRLWQTHVLPEPRANRRMRSILSHYRSPIRYVNCCSQGLGLPVPPAHHGPRNKQTTAVLSARPDGNSNDPVYCL